MKGCEKLEVRDNYLYFETNITPQTKKKITGHSFVELCGLSAFNKKGDTVLGLLEFYKNQVDPKYLNRGNIAEKIVELLLKKNNINYIYYTEEDKKKYGYDFFPQLFQFGGIPDFEIPEQDYLIEVKGKSMSKYDEIVKEQPKEEVYQGLYYSYLRGYKKAKLIWVFFDEETEKEIFAGKKPTTLSKCKIFAKDYDVNREELHQMAYDSALYYNKCIQEKRIPIEDISPKVLRSVLGGGVDNGEFRL